MNGTPTRTSRFFSRHALAAAVAASAMLLAGAGVAAACEGDEILLDEPFDDNLSNWPIETGIAEIVDGELVVTPAPDGRKRMLLPTFAFGDADICATFTFASDNETEAGLIFWGETWDNYYLFSVYNTGRMDLYRLKGNEWSKIVRQDDVAAINTAQGEPNVLRVTLKGNLGAFYVNGTEVHRFRAQKPASDSMIGVYVGGGEAPAAARFLEVKVTNVP